MNDSELRQQMIMLQKGDKAAFEKIYRELSTPVYTVIFRIIGDVHLSEDILQDVFLKLYRTPISPDVRKPRAYLFKTAHNMAVDCLKKQPRDEELDTINEWAASFDADSRIDIERALNRLDSAGRKIVVMHINGGLKFREIGEILDMPLGTVLWRYRRSIGQLRQLLSGGM